MNLIDLYKDVSLEIISKLDDFSKIQLLKTCKHFYNLHQFIYFTKTYNFSKIRAYTSVYNFRNILYDLDKIYHDCVPSSVTHLTFGYNFNKKIKKYIPASVKHLQLGNAFNQSIYKAIPNSVEYLQLGNSFDLPIDNCIPNSVTFLKFGHMFNQPVENDITFFNKGKCNIHILPKNIKTLSLDKNYKHTIKDSVLRSKIVYS